MGEGDNLDGLRVRCGFYEGNGMGLSLKGWSGVGLRKFMGYK